MFYSKNWLFQSVLHLIVKTILEDSQDYIYFVFVS